MAKKEVKKEVKIEEKVEVIEPKVKKPNAWLAHVKKYRADNPDCSYKDCLKKAKDTYIKGGAVKVEEKTHKMPDGKIMKGETHKEDPVPAETPVELTKSPAVEKKMKKVKKVKKAKKV